MSDGPYMSLPLKRRWKTVAERSSKDAWSVEDVVEATFHALERDLGEAPVQSLQRILGVGPEASLFGGDHEAVLNELDYARIECRGSAIGNAAIDGAIQAVLEGLAGCTTLTNLRLARVTIAKRWGSWKKRRRSSNRTNLVSLSSWATSSMQLIPWKRNCAI